MVVTHFPPIEEADEDGLLAIGGDLDTATLLLAYRSGIFPWPIARDLPLTWFAPAKRAVLFLDSFHPSQSLQRARRQTTCSFRFDTAFGETIRACARAKNRSTGRGTWITPAMIDGYTKLHEAGFAHSVECFDGEALIGGLYGVAVGSLFSGESMFYTKPNASKLALWHLVDHLRCVGARLIDCQVMNPFLADLGAVEISREEFMGLLAESLSDPPLNFSPRD